MAWKKSFLASSKRGQGRIRDTYLRIVATVTLYSQVNELCEAANKEVGAEEGVRIANFLCNGNYAVSGGLPGCEVSCSSFASRSRSSLDTLGKIPLNPPPQCHPMRAAFQAGS